MERTLIIFKPDSNNNIKLKKDIRYALKKYGLEVIKKEVLVLDEQRTLAIWKHCADDYVLKQLLFKYLSGKKLKIYYILGNDAVRKGNVIKRFLRNKYGKSYYSNCVHIPDSYEEYIYDFELLKTVGKETIRKRKLFPQKEGENNFNLEKNELDFITEKLWRNIFKKNITKVIQRKIATLIYKKENFALARLREKNNIIDILSMFIELNGEDKYYEAYYATLIFVELGSYPLSENREKKDIICVCDFVRNYGIGCDMYIEGKKV